MSFFNPAYLTVFQKKKVKELAQLAKENVNPLSVTVHASGASHTYSVIDVRNYFESINKQFDFVM